MRRADIERLEIELLVRGIQQRYGYDFGNYAPSSLRRRIANRMAEAGFDTVSDLLAKLLHDESLFEDFLRDMSVTVTEMFRDPPFFRAIRQYVVPVVKTIPFAKIWHAGCATGQEVYSMAILLYEYGCLERCRIYATDYNNRSLAIAAEGVFPLQHMRQYAANYYEAGGRANFSDYFYARYGRAKMSETLRRPLTFANHNLVEDPPLADIDLIVCRNVLIYFDQTLQERVFKLFLDSLSDTGLLCLGTAETVELDGCADKFEPVCKRTRIFRKIGNGEGQMQAQEAAV